MTARPILFRADMIRAILEGRKTQTRRSVQPQSPRPVSCPWGSKGDTLWVREAWSVVYRADGEKIGRWLPSIHMPRAASRLLLSVTDVRVERLHDITGIGAFLEGFASRDEFKLSWTRNHADWRFNPWVWVITFKRQGETS